MHIEDRTLQPIQRERDQRRSGLAAWQRVFAVGLALFGLALLPRVYQLGAQSLWLDEGSTWQITHQSWIVLLGDLFNPVSAYPLYHLLLKGWTLLAGDSEAALRFPSALAGAGAVVAIFFAAVEVHAASADTRAANPYTRAAMRRPFPLVAALLALCSPFAIWFAQDAKVYSLLLCIAALLLWATLRALRCDTWQAWLLVAGVAFVGLFVHRLSLLVVVAALVAIGLSGQPERWLRIRQARVVWWASVLLLSVAVVGTMVWGLGADWAVTGAAIPANPLTALGLTFTRFSLDRWPGDAPLWWLLPWLGLLVLGVWQAWRTRRQGDKETRKQGDRGQRIGRAQPYPELVEGQNTEREQEHEHLRTPSLSKGAQHTARATVLCFLLVPLGLFLIQLVFTRLYEARYLVIVYPAWVLLLAYGTGHTTQGNRETRRQGERETRRQGDRETKRVQPFPETGGPAGPRNRQGPLRLLALLLVGGAVAASVASLWQPTHGLFSGDPVKEQYREAIAVLAHEVQPDDAVVVHPGYLRPLYSYYMRRFTADPPPEPITFADFWQGETTYGQREWDIERRDKLAGYTRSLLLIAPNHARTVDKPVAGDEYGLVGNFWAFSREQRTWPCGIWRFNGAHLLCQEAPEAYYTGAVPEPATPSTAQFGADLRLLGYTLKATMPAGPAVYRAGGTLPITLFWDVNQPLATDYSMFLHLCQDCNVPPIASDDNQPLEGYLPTSNWLPGKPARDDRAIQLPADMPPGRYTLLLGVYPPGDPALADRLVVRGGETLSENRLVLGTVEIVEPTK